MKGVARFLALCLSSLPSLWLLVLHELGLALDHADVIWACSIGRSLVSRWARQRDRLVAHFRLQVRSGEKPRNKRAWLGGRVALTRCGTRLSASSDLERAAFALQHSHQDGWLIGMLRELHEDPSPRQDSLWM